MFYTEKFMETCFDYENAEKLMNAFGAAIYHDKSVLGKIFIICGKAGSGKSSILRPFHDFVRAYGDRKILIFHDFDVKALSRPWINEDEVMFCATNSMPADFFETITDKIEVIKTTGDRMPYDIYQKFCYEIDYFPEEFFKKCAIQFVLTKEGLINDL